MRNSILAIAMLLSFSATGAAQETLKPVSIKPTALASGQQMYHEYCASCHGAKGDGRGPAASACTVKPRDLRELATRYGGSFPYDYFYAVLRFGPLPPAHGAADMPVWLPIFASLDGNEAMARQRMHNIASYVASLQSK